MLRLSTRSLDIFPSSELYESTEEKDSRLRFFSESVSRLGGVMDIVGDLRRRGDALVDPIFRKLCSLESRRGDGDREIPVDIVEMEADEADLILFFVPGRSRSSLCLSRFLPLS